VRPNKARRLNCGRLIFASHTEFGRQCSPPTRRASGYHDGGREAKINVSELLASGHRRWDAHGKMARAILEYTNECVFPDA
jgi:hypothetical protein